MLACLQAASPKTVTRKTKRLSVVITMRLDTIKKCKLFLLFSLQGHDWLPVVLQFVSLLLAGFSVTRAVTSIERVNNVMMPLLLLVLSVSFYWSLTLKYASHGITYLFTPDWGELQHSSGGWVNCVEELLGWADCAMKFLGG